MDRQRTPAGGVEPAPIGCEVGRGAEHGQRAARVGLLAAPRLRGPAPARARECARDRVAPLQLRRRVGEEAGKLRRDRVLETDVDVRNDQRRDRDHHDTHHLLDATDPPRQAPNEAPSAEHEGV